MTRRLRILSCALAAVLLLPAAAPAQFAAEFALGANQGLRDDFETREGYVDTRVGAVYAARIFRGDLHDPSCEHRFGLSVITQQAKGIPEEGDGFAWNHRATFVEAEIERVLNPGSRVMVVLGLGLGFAARSLRNENAGWNYCDSPFCNSPDFSWTVSPGVRVFVPLAGKLSATVGVRGNYFAEGWGRYTPFESGTMVLAGVSWSFGPVDRPAPHDVPVGTPRWSISRQTGAFPSR
ncbi:hypothetical protein H8E07_09500 [bacterium]|nr:hypothetical protein [bacterium]